MANQKNRPVKTTTTSLELLETIKELDGATVGELTDHSDLARSTIHNHLQTLLDAEYVVKENNTYHVGLKLFHLGEYARTRKQEYKLAEKAVHELSDRTEMEADFNIEEHGRLVNLFDKIAHSNDLGLETGNYFYMHSTAAGKAMLAEMSEQRRTEILDTHGLPQQTENTITDREELLAELETVREHGYGINDEECFLGYKTIGMAICYPDGSLFGGIAVGGPTYLIDSDLNQMMRQTLFAISEELESDIAAVLFNN